MAACDAGADALGFNFAEEARKKNRYINPEDAAKIVAELPPFITTVAVTVNASLEDIESYLTFVDRVQLHGEEPASYAQKLRACCIQVFRTGPDFQLDALNEYSAGAILLDAGVPGERGGTGQKADWNLAKQAVDRGYPIILAGGLTPDNVAEAVRTVRPYGVDTAGGVESEPGRKDHERIRAFIHNAKIPRS